VNVLIVEDEPEIASFMTKGLTGHGYRVRWVSRASDALKASSDADLVVLDLGLPDVDGLEVLRELRRRRDRTEVLIVTARSEVDDVVAGLELGADDYLVKPFAFDELVARIRTRERAIRAAASVTVLQAGDLGLDLTGRAAEVAGRRVRLSEREFDLLHVLLAARGEVRTRAQLLESVWGFSFDPGTNIVDVYIGNLRRKIGRDRIETIRGQGYRLAAMSSRAN
jgi:DNA-binding response OmpR family regulator